MHQINRVICISTMKCYANIKLSRVNLNFLVSLYSDIVRKITTIYVEDLSVTCLENKNTALTDKQFPCLGLFPALL